MKVYHNQTNEKTTIFQTPIPSVDCLFTIAFPASFSPFQSIKAGSPALPADSLPFEPLGKPFFPVFLSFRWSFACGLPQLRTANCNFCWFWISWFFATEITLNVLVSDQHLDSPYGDPEKTPDNSKAGEQTGFVSTWSTFVVHCFSCQPWHLTVSLSTDFKLLPFLSCETS